MTIRTTARPVAHLWDVLPVMICGECGVGVMDFAPDGVVGKVCTNPACGVVVLSPAPEPRRPIIPNPYTRTKPRRRRRG